MFVSPRGELRSHYSKILSVAEASSKARNYLTLAKVALIELQTTLAVHGDTIVRRWHKWKPEKREKTIRALRPNIHFSKLMARSGVHGPGLMRSQGRKIFTLSSVNLEDFTSNSVSLPGLLYSRSAFPPEAWARIDHHDRGKAWCPGHLREESVEGSFITAGDLYPAELPLKEHRNAS